jgi:hypothetical protein
MTATFEHYQREKVSRLNPSNPLFEGIRVSAGVSKTAHDLSSRLEEMLSRTEAQPSRISSPAVPGQRERAKGEELYDALATAKVMTSKVSMHLDDRWRRDLFSNLDEMLNIDNWHDDDAILKMDSFETFLRFAIFVDPTRQPHLGISNEGNLLAGWIDGRNRLSFECLAQDTIRWVLVRYLDDERETAAAQVSLLRLMVVLAPFEPQKWLFDGRQPDR